MKLAFEQVRVLFLKLATSEVASYADALCALWYCVMGPKNIFEASYLENAPFVTKPLKFPGHDGETRELPY